MVKNTLFRKGLVFAIIVLFVTMNVISSTGSIAKNHSSIDSEYYGFVISLLLDDDSN